MSDSDDDLTSLALRVAEAARPVPSAVAPGTDLAAAFPADAAAGSDLPLVAAGIAGAVKATNEQVEAKKKKLRGRKSRRSRFPGLVPVDFYPLNPALFNAVPCPVSPESKSRKWQPQ